MRHLLATLREAGATGDVAPEPRVVLLKSAFAPEIERGLEIINEVSRTLAVALPGSQSIALVVLVPPAVASNEAKMQTFRSFARLEEAVGDVPFLDVVFINRLSINVYEALIGENADQTTSEEISELLYRELLDPVLALPIRRIGYQAVRNRKKVLSRKSCYSTAGSYHLVYLAEAGVQHLKARFQHELFKLGLMNLEALTEEEREAVQQRADAFIQFWLNTLEEQLPELPQVSGAALSRTTGEHEEGKGRFAFEEEINRAIGQAEPAVTEIRESLTGFARHELIAFLPESPHHLAGAQLFLDALRGQHLVAAAPEDMQLSGVVRFENEFCSQPFVAAVEDLFRANLGGIVAEIGEDAVRGKKEEESFIEWLRDALDTIEASAPGAAAEASAKLNFIARSFGGLLDYLKTDPWNPQRARELVQQLFEVFRSVTARDAADFDGKKSESKRAEEQHASYGWLQRHVTKRSEYTQVEKQIEGLTREMHGSQQRLMELRKMFIAQINQIVLPIVLRTKISLKVRQEILQTTSEFETFVASIADPIHAQWLAAMNVPEFSTSTRATVLTKSRLEILYARELRGKSMPAFVEEVLAFFRKERRKELSYLECRNLSDHYQRGSESVLDRLEDFSEVLFDPVRRLETLDIIEIEGREFAERFLIDRVSKMKSLLGFAPGMLPQVEAGQVMNTIFAVQTAGGASSRLAAEYDHVFEPQNLFIDSGDPHAIHIACLAFGFPAFLIHALHEGRQLVQASGNPPVSDLWP